ncbi:MAG: hypothetical protein R3B90_06250 [Planctomycetaceae bacterium]
MNLHDDRTPLTPPVAAEPSEFVMNAMVLLFLVGVAIVVVL